MLKQRGVIFTGTATVFCVTIPFSKNVAFTPSAMSKGVQAAVLVGMLLLGNVNLITPVGHVWLADKLGKLSVYCVSELFIGSLVSQVSDKLVIVFD